MTRKGKRKNANVCFAASFILACCLAQTIDCSRLRKTERRGGRNEADTAKTIGVQEGKIVFGRIFAKGSGVESEVVGGSRKASSNASVEDETAYQADFAGWSQGQAQDAGSKEASWKRMAPSLQCGGDQMKFRAVGPGASHFTVGQAKGNAPPVPLTQVPSSCGYSMQRNSLALVMLVPYDGCNMVQEGGSYMLPMQWQGIPVSLWCPKPAAPAATTAAPHHPVPQTPRYPPLYPQMPHTNPLLPPYFFPPYLPPYHSVVVPEATTATTTTTTKKTEMPKFPQYPSYFPPLYHFFPPPLPVTTAAPTTTTVKPAATAPPLDFPFPFYPPIYRPIPWPFPQPQQTTTEATTTTKPTTKPQLPQFPQYLPVFPPYPVFPPNMPPYPYFPTAKPMTTTTPPPTTTTTTTTTKKTDPIQTVPPHFHPHEHMGVPFPSIHFPFPIG